MSDFKVGDFVEVDLGLALCAIGEIITENAYRNSKASYCDDYFRERHTRRRDESTPSSFKIRFLDKSTHTANPEEMRLLTEKEQFILKLKGGEDKKMAKIYAALDEIND
jgi:hypothetical protein